MIPRLLKEKLLIKPLQDNIDAEETARTEADTALGARIDKEIQDRTNADNALGTRIDDEEDAREAADTQLQTNITAEETARIAADKTLQDNIDATNAHTINTLVWIQTQYLMVPILNWTVILKMKALLLQTWQSRLQILPLRLSVKFKNGLM